ncbi:MAG: rhodanese-like domain-containing protein [Verrucomicrobia bacterium]|nr:rhodanese-like domain-containing protein [Verrucomicrobiota bacterium]
MKKELLVVGVLAVVAVGLGWAAREMRGDHLLSPPAVAVGEFPAKVDLAAFRKMVEGKTAVIFDARAKRFYDQGHVPGAVSLPKPDFDREGVRHPSLAGVVPTDSIVVYCSGPQCHDSGLVADGLAHLGYGKIFLFKGGWHEWREAGYPAESAP